MKGILISEGREFYTDLRGIFLALGDIYKEYNWLITDYVCYPRSSEIKALFSGEPVVISGEELMNVLGSENFQWIWGVFSAIRKNVSKDEIVTAGLPRAEGNSKIWSNPVTIQHPMADIEIIAWDSNATVIIAKDDSLVEDLKNKLGPAKDLEKYNE